MSTDWFAAFRRTSGLNPYCEHDQCAACPGIAWDDEKDDVDGCSCPCHKKAAVA